MSNYQLTTRQIALPPELSDVVDEDLKKRITSRIRAPFDRVGTLPITIEWAGKSETLNVDDQWLKKERKRIEDEYTFQINNFGRAILSEDRPAFDEATNQFQIVIEKYQAAVREKLTESKADFEKRIIDEFGPKWDARPPARVTARLTRYGTEATMANIRSELRRLAVKIFDDAISFDDPRVRVLYKNVAPENISDPAFSHNLRNHMDRRGVPQNIIDSLFESGHAAPEKGAFLGR